MERTSYFEYIKLNQSPLLKVTDALDKIFEATAKARAAFIRLQIGGIETEDLFEEFRESWGIPKFEENLVMVNDFKNGFFWTFRDHTTSWNEDNEARDWFYTHIEARFARRYEFWSCDHGPEEMLLLESGDFKNILLSNINKHEDFSPFINPVFSRKELKSFYNSFNEVDHDFDKASLLEIMEENENW